MNNPTASYFYENVRRDAVAQVMSISGIASVARDGRQEVDTDTKIEDNGFAAAFLTDQIVTQTQAEQSLENVFLRVRKREVEVEGISEHASSTAAMALLTNEGVAWRNAGDSLVFAVGDNGEAVLLSQMQSEKVGQIDQLGTALYPNMGAWPDDQIRDGDPNYPEFPDDKGFRDWNELKQTLKAKSKQSVAANNVRIITVTDAFADDALLLNHGMQKGGSEYRAELENMMALYVNVNPTTGVIDFDDPNYAETLMKVIRGGMGSRIPAAVDDLCISTAVQPNFPREQSLIGVFDGVGGSGGLGSATVARMGVEEMHKEAQIMAGQTVQLVQPREVGPSRSPGG